MHTRFGGTIKNSVPKNGKLYFCSGCGMYLQNHWYTHQCFSGDLPKCYECLRLRNKCKRCGRPYTSIVKTDTLMYSL